MANQYGVVGRLGETILTTPSQSSVIPVYIGVAPIHLAPTPAAVNEPVLITGYQDAVNKLGYADNSKYDLSEVVDAHFLNTIQPIGPIVCINVFDPLANVGATTQNATITMNGGYGYLDDQDCVPSTIAGSFEADDVKIEYDPGVRKIKITDLTGAIGQSLEITYKRTEVNVNAATIIGASDETGTKTGANAVHYVYQVLGIVPGFLCAPNFSGDQGVQTALRTISQAASGRFFAPVMSDVPIANDDPTKAIAAKSTSGLTTETDFPSWTMCTKGDRVYHLSVLRIVAFMQTDAANGGVPFESADNKELDIDGVVLAPDKRVLLDIDQADRIKANGIATVLRWGGKWRLWGCHTGAYAEGLRDVDPRSVFDSSVRMLYYVLNTFNERYFDELGKPMTKNRLDSIVVDINKWLDALVTQGALLFAKAEPDVSESANDTVMGRVRFNLRTTTTPPLTLITAVLAYTDEGMQLLIAE